VSRAIATGRPLGSARDTSCTEFRSSKIMSAHQRPSSWCCQSRFCGIHRTHGKSSFGLHAHLMKGRPMKAAKKKNAPTLTPARRSSESFSTVLTLGPVHHKINFTNRAPSKRMTLPIVAMMDVCKTTLEFVYSELRGSADFTQELGLLSGHWCVCCA
jgi:hypothetical protein